MDGQLHPLPRIRKWFLNHKNKIGLIAVGHTAKKVEEYLFDWLLYGVVVYKTNEAWGPIFGSLAAFVIMAPLSAFACWLYIKFYDWAKIDWLGFEMLKELKETETTGLFGRIFQKATHHGKIPIFILLSIHGDPFMTTIYFRKGVSKHDGLTARDWKIFWTSVIFSNAYWTLRFTVIFAIAIYVWERFLAPLFG